MAPVIFDFTVSHLCDPALWDTSKTYLPEHIREAYKQDDETRVPVAPWIVSAERNRMNEIVCLRLEYGAKNKKFYFSTNERQNKILKSGKRGRSKEDSTEYLARLAVEDPGTVDALQRCVCVLNAGIYTSKGYRGRLCHEKLDWVTNEREPHNDPASLTAICSMMAAMRFHPPRFEQERAQAFSELVQRFIEFDANVFELRKKQVEATKANGSQASTTNIDPFRLCTEACVVTWSDLDEPEDVGRTVHLPPMSIGLNQTKDQLIVMTKDFQIKDSAYGLKSLRDFEFVKCDAYGRVFRGDSAIAHDVTEFLCMMATSSPEGYDILQMQGGATGKCLCCGRPLKAGDSMERSIGPVCWNRLKSLMGSDPMPGVREKARECRAAFEQTSGLTSTANNPIICLAAEVRKQDGTLFQSFQNTEVWETLNELLQCGHDGEDVHQKTNEIVDMMTNAMGHITTDEFRRACADITFFIKSSAARPEQQATNEEELGMAVFPSSPELVYRAVRVADFIGVPNHLFVDVVVRVFKQAELRLS